MKKAFFVIAISCFGCEVVVDVDIPIKPASITVHSIINPDSLVEAYLFPSQHVLSNELFEPLEGAKVDLYEDGEFLETLEQVSNLTGFSYYKGQRTPREGHIYTLEVSKDQFNSVRAETNIPLSTSTLSEISSRQANSDDQYFGEQSFTVTLNDPPGPNYYQIIMYAPYLTIEYDPETGERTVTDTSYHRQSMNSNDPIFSDFSFWDGTLMTSDALFDGKSVKINFTSYLPYYYDHVPAGDMELHLILKDVSEPLYLYQTTSTLQNNLDGDPFAEPVPVYNNVERGFGVFGGFTQKAYSLVVAAPQ